MSNFRCNIVEHTTTEAGYEAITFDLCYERFIHAEFMTHRWARNASSSRAIPYRAKDKAKMGMVDWTLSDPALPLHWGANKSGMQSGQEVIEVDYAKGYVLGMLHDIVRGCDTLYNDLGLHKEIVNRYIEPWGWINVVATMGKSQLMNAFKLRVDKHAHPSAQRLFVNMARQFRSSTPRLLVDGAWHLPFIMEDEWAAYADPSVDTNITTLLMWSVARCAWCSFKTVDGKVATFDVAKKRHDDCVTLKHMTPCEHQLRAGGSGGCVPGYEQYRHTIPGESAAHFDFSVLDTVYSNVDFVIP